MQMNVPICRDSDDRNLALKDESIVVKIEARVLTIFRQVRKYSDRSEVLEVLK